MIQSEQIKAAKNFAERWTGHGYEKGESQKFWIDLLTSLFEVRNIAQFIFFEEQVKEKIAVSESVENNKKKGNSDKLNHHLQIIRNFIDAYIPSTRVMIEQKSSNKNLREPIKQSDGSPLTPFQQAKKYVADLPLSQHPKWIVTCNFNEFLVYDMENPSGEPEQIFLKDLPKDFYRLQFLVDQKSEKIRREEEISIEAGKLVDNVSDPLHWKHSRQNLPRSAFLTNRFESESNLSFRLLCKRHSES